MEDEFFTIAEVAAKYKVHHHTVRTWIKTGALTARALPAGKKQRYRIPWSSLEEFGTPTMAVAPEPKPEPAKPMRRRRKYRPTILRE